MERRGWIDMRRDDRRLCFVTISSGIESGGGTCRGEGWSGQGELSISITTLEAVLDDAADAVSGGVDPPEEVAWSDTVGEPGKDTVPEDGFFVLVSVWKKRRSLCRGAKNATRTREHRPYGTTRKESSTPAVTSGVLFGIANVMANITCKSRTTTTADAKRTI
eukprot:TRINITY_DN3484_c0_g1_i6.p1 TRINITY_DN3484_c0_g1~~TRINITY_DN3484_c0_g1_i6.p1  ORF type:complete len:163 (-),score=8.65 TRINITY_DN3484_c0_g1_i6:204-692(-)